MNINELRRLFPNATESVIRRNFPAIEVGNQGNDCAVIQEQQTVNRPRKRRKTATKAASDYESALPEDHGRDGGQFSLTATFRFPDYRRRDLDGRLSTLCDCIIRARRRCLEDAPADSH